MLFELKSRVQYMWNFFATVPVSRIRMCVVISNERDRKCYLNQLIREFFNTVRKFKFMPP